MTYHITSLRYDESRFSADHVSYNCKTREPTQAMSRFIIERDVHEKLHQPKTFQFPK